MMWTSHRIVQLIGYQETGIGTPSGLAPPIVMSVTMAINGTVPHQSDESPIWVGPCGWRPHRPGPEQQEWQ